MNKLYPFFRVLLFICILFSSLFAQRKIYYACKVNPYPPVIDGIADDEAWTGVEWEEKFIQNQPYEGEPPSQRTGFKIIFDEKNLYVLIRAYDSEPGEIDRRVARRDDWQSDLVDVFIDSNHDHRTAFLFLVTPAGVKTDAMCSNDGGADMDFSWDPVWFAETSVDDLGWLAEMKIPFSQLRFGNAKNQIWGLQVERWIFRNGEVDRWQLMPRETAGFTSLFGEMHGISGIKSSPRIEVLPYAVGKVQRFKTSEENPFDALDPANVFGGLDGKIGLSNDLTVDFSINPDFGQVEADPSVVNLTTFETFFEEKRPLFIEGKEILNYRISDTGNLQFDTLFYSRRIGSPPHHEPAEDENIHILMPEYTSIIGAFKLTGKTENGISIGILESLTAHEKASIDFLGQRYFESVEPLTNYFVSRFQKDLNAGNTIIGGIITATNRNIRSPALNFLHASAYTGGFDFQTFFKNKSYAFTMRTVFSQVRGSPAAIFETQTSPVRYFQRPDAEHLSVDPSRTLLSGHGGFLDFGKSGGGHLRYSVSLTWRSPGLELNDLGFLRSADVIQSWMKLGYVQFNPVGIFLGFSCYINFLNQWNFGGEKLSTSGSFRTNCTFKNRWDFTGVIARMSHRFDPNELRGGPSLLVPGNWGYVLRLDTDSNKRLLLSAGISSGIGEQALYRFTEISFGGRFRVTEAMELSVSPYFSINNDSLQYVATGYLDMEERYICSQIKQKTAGVTFRLNFCITPELSIQYYGQPFVSSADYTDFKRIANPRAEIFDDRFHTFSGDEIRYDSRENKYLVDEGRDGISECSFSNPDFNFLQFHSNLVLRWEYRPGSTFFFVWVQARTGTISLEEFSFLNDMRDLFHIPPNNVFLIKFSHWFSI